MRIGADFVLFRNFALVSLLAVSCLWGSVEVFGAGASKSQTATDVAAVKSAIRSVQPFLPGEKVDLYAAGIHQAATRYGVDPLVLVAIADQESDFREGLPEGAAGEIGMMQIRKVWLKNALFRAEFKRATVKDLRNPSKSFLYAAWILKDLKKREKPSSALPYWTRYNSPSLEARQKYFALVNRKLNKVRDDAPAYLADNEVRAGNLAH